MKDWPYLIILVLLVAMIMFSRRARRRQQETADRRSAGISVGTEVMTTAGLYGTVVAKSDDGTVTLSIAPGVEVKWASAALREIAQLPERYRRGAEPPVGGTATGVEALPPEDDGRA